MILAHIAKRFLTPSMHRRADMQITESKLRQIILQEVQLRLIEYYVDEEIEAIVAEDETDDEYDAAKSKARKRKLRNAALGAGALGAMFGGLGGQVSDYEDTLAAKYDAVTAKGIADANTDEAQFDEFVGQLNNQYRYRWGKGNSSVVYYPGSRGQITVLPPSYSVAIQAFEDKKDNAERIARGEKPILRYGDLDAERQPEDTGGYQGNYEENISGFFDEYRGAFVDAMEVVGSHDELRVVPGSGTEKMIVMVDPDQIDGNYYLPELGMTAADYYNSQYEEFMGSGEREAIESPEEGSEELNPELVQKTKERADSLKESKITWKNYKNRKKVLA